MSYELRDYQEPAFEAGMRFFGETNPKPSLIIAPTAFGKSVLIAHFAQQMEGNTLIIQPSKELLEQNYRKFISLGGRGSIFSASFNKRNVARATYATIGSICKIGKLFKEWNFQNLIIDEAHLYPRDVISDKNVEDGETGSMLATFLYESGIKKVLGLTCFQATKQHRP
jgi:DNA repair protein RadD